MPYYSDWLRLARAREGVDLGHVGPNPLERLGLVLQEVDLLET
jgi:hypothetical protein